MSGINSTDRTGAGNFRAMLSRGLGTFAVRVAAAILSLLSGVVLGRILGIDEFGRYAYATSWAAVLAIPAGLRANMLIVRLASAHEVEERWAELRGALGALARRVSMAGACVVALGAAAILIVARRGPMPAAFDEPTLWLVLFTVPMVGLGQLAQGYLEARQWTVVSQIPDILARQAMPLLIVAGAAVAGVPVGAAGAGLALLAGSLAFLALQLFLALRARPAAMIGRRPVLTDALDGRIAPLVGAGVLLVVTQQAGPLIIGALTEARDVAVYVAASRFANVLVFLPASLNVAFGATAARLWASGAREELGRVASRTALTAFAGNVALAAPLVLAAAPLLGLLGPEFRTGSDVLCVLVLGQLASNLGGPNGIVLVMTGHERDAALGMGIAALATTGLTAIAAPLAGAVGAAWASVAGTVVWNVVLSGLVRRRLGVGVGVVAGLAQLVRAGRT